MRKRAGYFHVVSLLIPRSPNMKVHQSRTRSLSQWPAASQMQIMETLTSEYMNCFPLTKPVIVCIHIKRVSLVKAERHLHRQHEHHIEPSAQVIVQAAGRRVCQWHIVIYCVAFFKLQKVNFISIWVFSANFNLGPWSRQTLDSAVIQTFHRCPA